ncbi:MAG: 3-isopropylmalate dehydratase small subunit [Pseudomonadota bacterium]
MTGWTRHQGRAVALPAENIDTDQLIAARFMSAPREDGYGDKLLYDARHDEAGAPIDHPLNRWPGASVLIAGRNFGCGSSREAAVYALFDHGFRAVLAPGFGDIFAANAANNGLLAAEIGAREAATLINALRECDGPAEIDLAAQRFAVAGVTGGFAVDPVRRVKLMKGWDDIDLTADRGAEIAAFRAAYAARAPWATPRG